MSIIKGLKNIQKENLTSFHVPGHKGRGFLPQEMQKDIQRMDITEIPGSDNLHNAQAMIAQAQKTAAKVFGAKKTYFLVNGTTVGIQAMILATCRPGDKLLVPRNCHRSVWSGLILGDIHPVYITPEYDPISGVALSVSPEKIEEKLKQHPDIKGAVITYPTYYGTCPDLEKISKILHNRDKLLLVDEAHGAHLHLHKELPLSALEAGADITVQSSHKLLSALTQASMLHIGSSNISLERVEMFLSSLQTSSPSYPLMASLDFATQQAEGIGSEKWGTILQWNKKAQEIIHIKTHMKVKGRDFIGKHEVTDYDDSKLWIDVSPLGLKGTQVEDILRKDYGIQVELSDPYHILAMTGMGTQSQDIEKLTKALIDIEQKYYTKKTGANPIPIKPIQGQMALPPREAIYSQDIEIPLEESGGRISKEFIIPYPPGIPMVLPGEIITEEIIGHIKQVTSWGGQIIGPQDQQLKRIKVIKE